MPEADVWTIGRLLTWTTDYLKRTGADSPRLDAEVLLAHVRRCSRIHLYTAYEEAATEELRREFRELVRRRAAGTPVAYLVGRREFYSLSFRVTPDVLIPRPETELVVVESLDLIKKVAPPDRTLEVADVGTGSGCIAICLAKLAPRVRVTALDASGAALEVARGNAAEHGVSQRIEFLQGDLLADLPASRAFDLIVSNPPYIGESELAAVAGTVKDYEPRQALVAGPTGTEVIARLIPQAAGRLCGDGWLIMEVSPIIVERVQQLIARDTSWEEPLVVKDLAGLPRVIKCRRRLRGESRDS